jgi:hypothetical protein
MQLTRGMRWFEGMAHSGKYRPSINDINFTYNRKKNAELSIISQNVNMDMDKSSKAVTVHPFS